MTEVVASTSSRFASGRRTVFLGFGTLASALTDGVIIGTYTGPALVPDSFLVVLLVAVVLLAATIVSFALTVPVPAKARGNTAGFLVGTLAIPGTVLLLATGYSALNGLGISW